MTALRTIAERSRAEANFQAKPTRFQPMEVYQIEPFTERIPEVCRISGIGRSKLYELIKAREIAIIKVGAITLFSMGSLKAYLGIDRSKPS